MKYEWFRFWPAILKCLVRLPLKHVIYFTKQLRYENPHRHNGKVYVNTFFPPYPSPAFDRFLDASIQRKRVPFSTYFAVTDQCPYKCQHCSYGNHQAGRLDTDQAKHVITQIKSLGTTTIGLTGGEPLLRNDIADLVRTISNDTACIIFTTGYNLTPGLAKDLKSAGLSCLMVGMESDAEVVHDAVRGTAGSFVQGVKAVELSLRAGLYTAISTIATRKKVTDGTLHRMAQLAERMGVHEFRILEPVPTGSYREHVGEMLTPEESRQVAKFHKTWNQRGKGPAVAAFAYLESDEMFGCGAGYHHLFIDAVGNVCPCDLTPLSFGNVFHESLSDIWQRMGQYFRLPCCGCFSKGVCSKIELLAGEQLPLAPERSQTICQHGRDCSKLPGVYHNLLKQ